MHVALPNEQAIHVHDLAAKVRVAQMLRAHMETMRNNLVRLEDAASSLERNMDDASELEAYRVFDSIVHLADPN